MKLLKTFAPAALFSGLAVFASAATPLINLVGEQAPFVVSFDDVPGMLKTFGESPWSKTWNDQQVRKFFAPLHAEMKFDELDAKLKSETGHTFAELVDFATGDALVAISSSAIDFESETAEDGVPFIAAIELGSNTGKVEKMIEDARKKNADSEHETEEFAGVTIHIATTARKGDEEAKNKLERVVWAMTDGVCLVGFNKDAVIAAVDALKKGGVENAFGKSSLYLGARQKTGGGHFSVYVNFKPIVARLQEEIAKKAGQEGQANPFFNPAAIIPALGVDAWNALYFSVKFSDAQTLMSGGFTFAEERGLLKMFSYGTGPVARPAFIPAKWITVTSAKFSLKTFYNGLEEMVGAYNPGVLGMGQMYLQQFNQQLGIDVKRDFFGSFGSDMVTGYAPRPGSNSAKPSSLEDMDQFIGFSLDNPKSFTAALDALTKMGGPQSEKMIAKREYLGSTISTIQMPNGAQATAPRSVSFTVAKNYLFVSMGSPAALESVLQASGPNFWDRPEVKRALAEVPDDASSVTYQDTASIISALFQTFVQIAKTAGTEKPAPFDASAAPNAGVFSKYWGDAVGYVVRDREGYVFKSTLEHKK